MFWCWCRSLGGWARYSTLAWVRKHILFLKVCFSFQCAFIIQTFQSAAGAGGCQFWIGVSIRIQKLRHRRRSCRRTQRELRRRKIALSGWWVDRRIEVSCYCVMIWIWLVHCSSIPFVVFRKMPSLWKVINKRFSPVFLKIYKKLLT